MFCRFILGLALLTNGWDGNAHCSWCHYLSCVPTPLWSCTEARCAVNLSSTFVIFIFEIYFNFLNICIFEIYFINKKINKYKVQIK